VFYVAEAAYNGGQVDDAAWGSRFKGVCKADPAAAMTVARMDPCERYEEGEISSRMLLWDDPMLALYRMSLLARERLPQVVLTDYYAGLADELSGYASEGGEALVSEAGHVGFAAQLAHTLAMKAALADRLLGAYTSGDRTALSDLAEDEIPRLSAAVERLWRLHRQVWMVQNKPFGFEVICIRYGGLLRRLEEIRLRLQEYLGGDVDRIDELEGGRIGLDERVSRYRSVATASSIL
jgi:hexosaminidase